MSLQLSKCHIVGNRMPRHNYKRQLPFNGTSTNSAEPDLPLGGVLFKDRSSSAKLLSNRPSSL